MFGAAAQYTVAQTNDLCDGAIALTAGATNYANLFNATTNGDPRPSCITFQKAIWYTFKPPANGRLEISTAASDFSSAIVVYTGACGNFAQLGCGFASLNLAVSNGATYYILAGRYSGVGTNLQIVANFPPTPTNDTCAGAITLLPNATNVVDNGNATTNGDPRVSCQARSYLFDIVFTYHMTNGVWYQIRPESNSRIYVTNSVARFRTVLTAFSGACGTLTELQCSGESEVVGGSYAGARLNFGARGGTTYYILAGGGPGTLQLLADILPPPTNDTFHGAIALELGQTNTLNIANATEIDDPNGTGLDHGVWYTVIPSRDTGIAVSTCDSDFNTGTRIYTITSGVLTDVVATPASLCDTITFAATSGTTYYILAGGRNTWAGGNLRIVAFESPLNDICAGAITMVPGLTNWANTLTATDTSDPKPRCATVGRGVWYKYTPAVTGPLTVAGCGGGLAAYAGTCGGTFTEIACSQFSFYCAVPRLKFEAVAGTTYYFLAQGDSEGDLQIYIPVLDLVSMRPFGTNSTGGPPIAGRRFSAGWFVTNQGANSFISSTLNAWTDRLSLSNAVTNIVMRFGAHAAPANNGYLNLTNFTLPAIPAGDYFLIADTDINQNVVETNENNNTHIVSIIVTNLPPSVTLLAPTNTLAVTSCVPVAFSFAASTQIGSYPITSVEFYDGATLLAQTNRAPYRIKSLYLPHGNHTITAQALDLFGLRGISQPATISVHWPGQLHRLRADLDTNGDCVACMRAFDGSNYLIETTTDLRPPVVWSPHETHQAVGSILLFTNEPLLPRQFFRAKLLQ